MCFKPGNGKEFEWIVNITLKGLGYKVLRNPLPGNDEGVDILVESSSGPLMTFKSAVQCKESCVRSEDVDRLMGTIERNKTSTGILITKGKATPGARKYARELGDRIKVIEGDQWREWEEKASVWVWKRLHNISQ